MSLQRVLHDEVRLVSEFVDVLTREQEMLVQGKVHDLGLITEEKTPLIDALMALASERDQLLRQAGFPAEGEGLKMWVALQANEKLTTDYEQLRKLSTEARRLNLLNSNLVSTRLQITQQALSILLPQEQSPALYDTQGQSAQRVGYKLIDSA